MGRLSRRRLVFGLALAATGLGCGGMNPFLFIPTLASGGQSKMPAQFKLAPHERRQDAKVVVLVSSKTGLDPELAGVDRMLNAELISILDLRVKENEDEVQVLKMPRIDEYKEEHPNWRTKHPTEVGAAVAEGTDYVIDVEIAELDLFKPGGRRQWLLGHAVVSVTAYDMSKIPLREPAFKKELSFEYPKTGEIEVESRAHISRFRMDFIRRIASDISIMFVDSSPHRHMD